MFETPDELARLQALLDASHARATDHLRGITHDDQPIEGLLLSCPDLKAPSRP